MTTLPRFSFLYVAFVISATLALAAVNASAQMQMHAHGQHEATAAAQNGTAALSEGEVKKVDKDAGKLTIKHGPLNNLNMPAMTMVFKVRQPAMLSQVKAGDHVRFVAEQVNGSLAVTRLETMK